MTHFSRPALDRGFMLRAFLLPALLLIPAVCTGNNGRITMTSTSNLRAESAMYHPTNCMQNTGASSIRCTYIYYTNTSIQKNSRTYSYEDACEGVLPSVANAFENVNAAGKSICPSRKDHRIEYVTVDMYPTPQQQEDNNYSPYNTYSPYNPYNPYNNYSPYNTYSPYNPYNNYSPYNNYNNYSNYSNYTPSNTYSNYATYSPALTMVGANSVAPIATTAGSSPYSNSPSRAPGITNIQRDDFSDIGDKDDPNKRPISPVGEAWSLLFLAAGYAWYTLAKRKKQQQTQEKL